MDALKNPTEPVISLRRGVATLVAMSEVFQNTLITARMIDATWRDNLATLSTGGAAMMTPLMMLGPGGDYRTHYSVKGKGLVRQAGAALGQQPDTETAGSYASWGQSRRRKPGKKATGASGGTTEAAATGVAVEGDRFEAADQDGDAGTYAPPGRSKMRRYIAPGLPGETAGLPAIAVAHDQVGATTCVERSETKSCSSHQTARPALRDKSWHPATTTGSSGELGAASAAALFTALATWLTTQQQALRQLRDQHHHQAAVIRLMLMENFDESDTQATSYPHTHPRLAPGARLFADDAGTRRRTEHRQGRGVRAHRGLDPQRRAEARSAQGALFGGQ